MLTIVFIFVKNYNREMSTCAKGYLYKLTKYDDIDEQVLQASQVRKTSNRILNSAKPALEVICLSFQNSQNRVSVKATKKST